MYNKIISSLLFLILILSAAHQAYAQDKRAQTTFKFITNPLPAKAAGMSDAVYSLDAGAEAVFANPATMSRQQYSTNIVAGQVQFIADIKYHYLAASFAPQKGRYGVFGINLISVDYGNLEETIRSSSEKGYVVLGTYNPNAYSFGASYSKALTEQFSFGGTIKYMSMYLGSPVIDYTASNGQVRQDFEAGVAAIDFGIHYKTGWKSLAIGIALKNLSQEVTFSTESTELPFGVRMGASMDILDLTSIDKNYHSLVTSVNVTGTRDFKDQVIVGMDYTFLNRISLRGGYLLPNEEQGASFGAGFRQPFNNKGLGLSIDYSYTDFGIFKAVNRLTVQFTF